MHSHRTTGRQLTLSGDSLDWESQLLWETSGYGEQAAAMFAPVDGLAGPAGQAPPQHPPHGSEQLVLGFRPGGC